MIKSTAIATSIFALSISAQAFDVSEIQREAAAPNQAQIAEQEQVVQASNKVRKNVHMSLQQRMAEMMRAKMAAKKAQSEAPRIAGL